MQISEKQKKMRELIQRINGTMGFIVPDHFYHIEDNNLVIAPYGSTGVVFTREGKSYCKEKDTFHIRLSYDTREKIAEIYNEYNTDEIEEIQEDENKMYLRRYEESIEEWEWKRNELENAMQYLVNYNAGFIAARISELDDNRRVFAILADKFINSKK